MYQIVIAEDDERMRIIVEKIIPWEKDSYNVCCSCSNGLEAKKYIDNYPVDVAILDINMPLLNGLELSKYIYENYPQVLVVIISAYKEFVFAKQAMQYDVLDYITKPITKSSIQKSFDKVRKKLESRNMNRFVDENKMVQRQQLFFGLMNNRLESSQIDLIKQLKCFNIDIDCDNYPCARLSIEIEQYDEFMNTTWHRDKESFYDVLQKIITAYDLQSYFSVLSIDKNYMEIVAISKKKNNINFDFELKSDIICIENEFEYVFGIHIKYIIRDIFSSINLYLDNQEIDERINNQILFTMNYLMNGENELMLKCIEDAEKTIVYEENLAIFYRKLIAQFEEDLDRLEKKFLRSEYFAINSIKEINKLKETTLKLAENTYRILFNTNNGENAIAEEAKRFIYENYSKDLSLQDVANLVSLNSCYFSSIFKKYAGIGFSAYLNQVRIDKAKEFLENTTLKPLVIAKMVGYKEVTYFYRAFRMATGCTPVEYRMKKSDKSE